MAVPKRKTSKARRDKRRANWKLAVPGLVACPQCGELKLPHRACKALSRIKIFKRRRDPAAFFVLHLKLY